MRILLAVLSIEFKGIARPMVTRIFWLLFCGFSFSIYIPFDRMSNGIVVEGRFHWKGLMEKPLSLETQASWLKREQRHKSTLKWLTQALATPRFLHAHCEYGKYLVNLFAFTADKCRISNVYLKSESSPLLNRSHWYIKLWEPFSLRDHIGSGEWWKIEAKTFSYRKKSWWVCRKILPCFSLFIHLIRKQFVLRLVESTWNLSFSSIFVKRFRQQKRFETNARKIC